MPRFFASLESMKNKIKIFGDTAREITENQLFVAKVGSVEGRTVVELIPYEESK